jgi:hypothetical protein
MDKNNKKKHRFFIDPSVCMQAAVGTPFPGGVCQPKA